MLAAGILVVIIVAILGSGAKRLIDLGALHPVVIVAMIGCAALPSWVAYTVLEPGEPVDSATVRKVKDTVSLEIPEGYSIMATANLTDEEEAPESEKTAYTFKLQGTDWGHKESGTFKRKGAGGGPDVSIDGGQGVTDSTRRRSGALGEDTQDRIDPLGTGPVEIEVTNWQGSAALSIDLDVVKGPPPGALVWLLAILVSLLGVYGEVKHGADRIAGDIGVLAMWAVFLRDGVTPLDDFQGVAKALLPAAFLGWGAAGGLAWLGVKYVVSREKAAEAEAESTEEEAEEPEVEAAPPPGTRRTRKRVVRRSSDGSDDSSDNSSDAGSDDAGSDDGSDEAGSDDAASDEAQAQERA